VSQLKPAVVLLVLLSVLTGLAYPLLVTVIAQTVFPAQANGSLIVASDGRLVGSRLIGQTFDDPKYFWGRLSATGPFAYNSAASSGSNLGPLNPTLVENAQGRIDALRQADQGGQRPIPVDLVTAGSLRNPYFIAAINETR